MITIEISLGEALDRLSILIVKGDWIKDGGRRMRAQQHAILLQAKLLDMRSVTPEMWKFYTGLESVNRELWKVEDEIRAVLRNLSDRTDEAHISIASRESSLIELAREVPRLNAKRAALKQQIDSLCGDLGEVKEYAE